MGQETQIKKIVSPINDSLGAMSKQLNILISLIARQVYTADKVREIIYKGRTVAGRRRALTAYNLFKGYSSLSEVADQAGMDLGNLSRAVDLWVEAGIVFLLKEKEKAKYYRHIFPIEEES